MNLYSDSQGRRVWMLSWTDASHFGPVFFGDTGRKALEEGGQRLGAQAAHLLNPPIHVIHSLLAIVPGVKLIHHAGKMDGDVAEPLLALAQGLVSPLSRQGIDDQADDQRGLQAAEDQ